MTIKYILIDLFEDFKSSICLNILNLIIFGQTAALTAPSEIQDCNMQSNGHQLYLKYLIWVVFSYQVC